MSGLLEGLPLGQIGAGGLLAIVVLLVLTGRLVPRSVLQDKAADCESWKQTANDAVKAATELGMAVEKLHTLASTTNYALNEITEALTRPEQ